MKMYKINKTSKYISLILLLLLLRIIIYYYYSNSMKNWRNKILIHALKMSTLYKYNTSNLITLMNTYE